MSVNKIADKHKVDSKLRAIAKEWNATHDGRSKITENEILSIQTKLASNDPKERRYASRAYQAAYPDSSIASSKILGARMMHKPKIIDTIEKVLENEGITKASTIRKHKALIDGAEKRGKFSAAISGNRDFMQATGVLKDEKTINHNHHMDLSELDKLTGKELDNKLADMLGSDIIEGEIVEEEIGLIE